MKTHLQKSLLILLFISASLGINAQSNFSVSLGTGSSNMVHNRSHILDNGNVITTLYDMNGAGTHIVMLTPTGNTIWSKFYADTRIDDIKVLSTGNIAFVGYYQMYGSTWGLLDPNGNQLWGRQYVSSDFNYDLASIDVLANGRILYNFSKYGGSFTVRCDENGDDEDDDEGEDTLGNGKNPSFDSFGCEDSGWVECGKSDDRIILIRHNANGDIIWAKNYLKSTTEYFHLKKIQELSDGSLMGVGLVSDSYTGPNNSAFMIKFDANGEVLWTKKYVLPPNPGYFSSTFRSFSIEGNNIYASGYYTTDYTNLNHFLMHLDQDGNVISAKQMVSTNNALTSVGVPSMGNVTFEHDMNNHTLVYNNYTMGNVVSVELNKVNFDGVLGCNEIDFPTDATSYTPFTSTATAYYIQTSITASDPGAFTDLSLTVTTSSITANNSCSILGISEDPLYHLTVYPNPASNVLNISGLNTDGKYTVQMIDMTGKLVQVSNGIEGVDLVSININGLTNGSYIIKISDLNTNSTKQLKWMKM